MLLDLFIAGVEGRLIGACSAAIGACAATTTGLRCIGLLNRNGLTARLDDPEDGRRSFVALSPAGEDLMQRVLSELDVV